MKTKNILYIVIFSCALIIIFVCLFFPLYYNTEFVYDDNGIVTDIITSDHAQLGAFADIGTLFSDNNYSLEKAGSIVFALFLLLLLICGFTFCILWLFFFIKKSKILPLSVPFFPFFLIRLSIILLGISNEPNILQLFPEMYVAYYITFAVTVLLVVFDCTRLILRYLKTHPRAPRPPRPRKPTSKERIAELEERVKELESIKKDSV